MKNVVNRKFINTMKSGSGWAVKIWEGKRKKTGDTCGKILPELTWYPSECYELGQFSSCQYLHSE